MTTPVKKACNGCGSKSRASALAAKAPAKSATSASDAWKAIAEKKRSAQAAPAQAPVFESKGENKGELKAQADNGTCSNEISYCVVYEVPNCFHPVTPGALVDPTTGAATGIVQPPAYAQIGTCGLTCETVLQTVTQEVIVTNPCDTTTNFTCDATVALNYIYARGSVDIVVGLAVQPNRDSDYLLPCALGAVTGPGQTTPTGSYYSYLSRSVKVCVDNLVCVACPGGETPTTCTTIFPGSAQGNIIFISDCSLPAIEGPFVLPCGDGTSIYAVRGTFLLNSCPIA